MDDLLATALDSTRLAALTDDDLASTETDLLAHFRAVRAGEVEGTDPDDLTALATIRDAVQACRAESVRRLGTLAEEQDEPAAEDDGSSEPLAASVPRPSLAQLAAAPRPAETQPRASTRGGVQVLSERGHPLASLGEIAAEFADRARVLEGTRPNGRERHRVATARAEYPEDRRLVGDRHGDGRRIEAVLASGEGPQGWNATITASGGLCAPLEPVYRMESISDASRPVRDSLPAFAAERGGIAFTPPLALSDISTAITVWDTATDASPGETTKGCQTITCATTQEVEVQAIVRCLGFGNFEARAHPERVEQAIAVTIAAHARTAEQELLDAIEAASTPVTTGAVLGAARDVLHFVGQAAAAIRSRQRMRPDARLRLLIPAWWLDMAAADIAFQQASGEVDALGVANAQVRAWLEARNVAATFFVDSETGAGQVFGAQGPTDLRNWPSDVHWYLYPEGSFLFLDGGTLDLGLVRDSTLNDTNDFQVFAETFEAVAFVGVESLAITSTVCPNGESQIASDETGSVCAAS